MKRDAEREPVPAGGMPPRGDFGSWMSAELRNGLAAVGGIGALALVLLVAAVTHSVWPVLVVGAAGLTGLLRYRRRGVWLHALWVTSFFLLAAGLVWLLFRLVQR